MRHEACLGKGVIGFSIADDGVERLFSPGEALGGLAPFRPGRHFFEQALSVMSSDKSVGRAEAIRRSMLAMIESGAANEVHPAL